MTDEFLPRPGVAVSTVLTSLKDLINEAKNTRAAAGNILIHRDTYLAWTSGAEYQLQSLFASPAVWQGLHTTRYWEVADINARTPRPSELIQNEATWQAARLQAIVDILERHQKVLGLPSDDCAAVVPDTNVFLHYEPYDDADWLKLTGSKRVRLVVPLLVIDELDDLSFRAKSEIWQRARGVIKSLRLLRGDRPPESPVPLPKEQKVELQGDAGPAGPPAADEQRRRDPHPRRISGRVVGTKRVYVVAGDYGMRLRAVARDLQYVGADKLKPRSPHNVSETAST